MTDKVLDWLDERLGIKKVYDTVLDRDVPKVNWWFTLGSASLFLLVMQGITGIFLTVYYVPTPDHAADSILYIMNGVDFGWLIRGIHHWGASLMVIFVFMHMLRTFYCAAYLILILPRSGKFHRQIIHFFADIQRHFNLLDFFC